MLRTLNDALLDGGRLVTCWQSPLIRRHRRRLRVENMRRLRQGRPLVFEADVTSQLESDHRLHCYLPHQIRRLLEDAGFEVVRRASVHELTKLPGSRRRWVGHKLWPISETWWVADKR